MKHFKQADFKASTKVAITVKTRLERLKINIPIIQSLCNPGLKPRHWSSINQILNVDITPTEETTLKDILKYKNIIDKHMEKMTEITNLASKEYALEQALKKMKQDWESMNFSFVQYKDTDLSILSSFDDILALLEDHTVKTSTIKNSPFVIPFEKEVNTWNVQLVCVFFSIVFIVLKLFLLNSYFDSKHRMKSILDNWVKLQSTWMYLEPIFSSEDICKQMEKEGDLFKSIDKIWRDVMTNSVKDSRAMIVVSKENLLENLVDCVSHLEVVNKGLNEYLEKKRLYFPRFFFLSNDELLEILSETKDPLRVEPHLKKCFEGIKKLKFNSNTIIEAMISSENEIVPLSKKINPKESGGLVERWLQQVEDAMRSSLRAEAVKAISSKMNRAKWISSYPGQIILASNIIYWTSEVTKVVFALFNLSFSCVFNFFFFS
jgi:dynein heavy chain